MDTFNVLMLDEKTNRVIELLLEAGDEEEASALAAERNPGLRPFGIFKDKRSAR